MRLMIQTANFEESRVILRLVLHFSLIKNTTQSSKEQPKNSMFERKKWQMRLCVELYRFVVVACVICWDSVVVTLTVILHGPRHWLKNHKFHALLIRDERRAAAVKKHVVPRSNFPKNCNKNCNVLKLSNNNCNIMAYPNKYCKKNIARKTFCN